MKYDKTTHIGDALIQYGKMNDRIYLMKIGSANPTTVVRELDELAESEQLGKIFAKIPTIAKTTFLDSGYQSEAAIPRFYKGKEDAEFLGKFIDKSRRTASNRNELEDVMNIAKTKANAASSPSPLSDGFSFHHCRDRDAKEMSKLYKKVFSTYPFPIHNPKYIQKTMHENILYFSIRHEGNIISLSSSEMDRANLNVEMTDFATLPEWRGNSFANFLLGKMEHEMKKLGMKISYTIARAISPGMNITFARAGYTFGGRLTNNTNISGNIESMNVWHKKL